MDHTLLEPATELATIATELGMPTVGTLALEETRRRIEDGHIRVAVVGEVRHGKSTLINALIGEDLLPTGVTPTTATCVDVRSGLDAGFFRRATVGDERIARERFAEAVRKPQGEGRLAAVVARSELPDRIEFIDTPGVNDGSDPHGDRARNELARADLVLFVLDATQLLSRSETAYLRDVSRAVGGLGSDATHAAFVVNRVDLVATEEHPRLRQHLNRFLAELRSDEDFPVFFTNAKGALSGDPDSGIAALRDFLADQLGDDAELLPQRARTALAQTIAVLRYAASVRARTLRMEREALHRELAELRKSAADADADLAELRKQLIAGRDRVVADSRSRVDRLVEDLGRSALLHVDSASLKTLSTYLPGSIRDAFLAFTHEECERVRAALDELTHSVLQTHGEQARRRLFQTSLRIGFGGPPAHLDPPSAAIEAGLVAIGVAGTAVMYLGSFTTGMMMTVAGPLATVFLRERSLRQGRAKAKARIPSVLKRSGAELCEALRHVAEAHVTEVEDHLLRSHGAVHEQLVAVVDRARAVLDGEQAPAPGVDIAEDVDTRREAALAELSATEERLERIGQTLAPPTRPPVREAAANEAPGAADSPS